MEGDNKCLITEAGELPGGDKIVYFTLEYGSLEITTTTTAAIIQTLPTIMKWLLTISMLIFFSMITFGQTRLLLKKSYRTVWLKPASTIGIVTTTDTLKYNRSLWKLDSISTNGFVVKKPDKYEYKTIRYHQLEERLGDEWTIDTIIRNHSSYMVDWMYTYKKPVTYISVPVPYKDIIEIEYAKSENTSGCIGCIFFPVMVILAPVVSWKEGKFQPSGFFSMFSIGLAGSLFTYNSFKRREVKNYKIGNWKIVTR